jgi:hypothetical protein
MELTIDQITPTTTATTLNIYRIICIPLRSIIAKAMRFTGNTR